MYSLAAFLGTLPFRASFFSLAASFCWLLVRLGSTDFGATGFGFGFGFGFSTGFGFGLGLGFGSAEEYRGLVGEDHPGRARLVVPYDIGAGVLVRDHVGRLHEIGIAPGVVRMDMRINNMSLIHI